MNFAASHRNPLCLISKSQCSRVTRVSISIVQPSILAKRVVGVGVWIVEVWYVNIGDVGNWWLLRNGVVRVGGCMRGCRGVWG